MTDLKNRYGSTLSIVKGLEKADWCIKESNEKEQYVIISTVYDGMEWTVKLDYNEMFDDFVWSEEKSGDEFMDTVVERLVCRDNFWENINRLFYEDN